MTSAIEISDEEIRRELEKEGYNDIPDDVFQIFKKDLKRLIYEEINKSSELDCSRKKQTFSDLHQKSLETDSFAKTLSSSSNNHSTEASGSADSFGERIVKRKTLRCRDGNAYISEHSTVSSSSGLALSSLSDSSRMIPSESQTIPQQFLDIPVPTTSFEGQQVIKDKVPVFRTSFSASLQSRTNILWERTSHRCDPVTRYHQYRKVWEKFKVPGERSHRQLRWNIRGQMLEQDIIVTKSWWPKVSSDPS